MARTPAEWREIVRALRAKADDKVTLKPEADALREKAAELEVKYCKSTSPPTDNTTVTGRDGKWMTYDDFTAWIYTQPGTYFAYVPSPQTAETGKTVPDNSTVWDILRNLKKNQYMWNEKYYDKDGNPKPGYGGEEDIVEDAYKEEPDDDYGYDIKEGDDW